MSFGSLSGNADRGAQPGRGDRRLPAEHRRGRALAVPPPAAATSSSRSAPRYFGCRDEHGRFDLARLVDLVAVGAGARDRDQAQPGRQARARRHAARRQGEPRRSPRSAASEQGVDCASPSRHTVFHDVDSHARLRRVGRRRDRAAGRHQVRGRRPRRSGTSSSRRWRRAARRRLRQHRRRRGRHRRGADDLRRLRRLPVPDRLHARSTAGSRRPASPTTSSFIGAGKLGFPENAVVAFALGADMVNVGREAMLSIGCIQAQKCHTDHCPVGVATQNPRYTPRPRRRPEERPRGQLRPTRCDATCSRSPRRSASSTRA